MVWSPLFLVLVTCAIVIAVAFGLRALHQSTYRTRYVPEKVFDPLDFEMVASMPARELLLKANRSGRFAAVAVQAFYCLPDLRSEPAVKMNRPGFFGDIIV